MSEEIYGAKSVQQLKEELKKRGAKVSGRKKDLIERLLSYDRNSNFGNDLKDCIKDDYVMVIPDTKKFMDVNSNTTLPPVSKETIKSYLLEKGIPNIPNSATQMYHNKYLEVLRVCSEIDLQSQEQFWFLRAICQAEMKKSILYDVKIKLDEHGVTRECHCECTVGHGPRAACKHIIVVLLAVNDFNSNQMVKVSESKTQKLQDFHKPKRKYFGSPVKAKNLPLNRYLESGETTLKPVFKNTLWYKDHFRNLSINFAYNEEKFPILQMYMPAAMEDYEKDHDYLEKPLSDVCLERLGVTKISSERSASIELITRTQSDSKVWKEERSLRITASNFATICKLTDRRDIPKLLESLINPTTFNTRVLLHGRRYEDDAIKKYMEVTDKIMEKCGLFIYEKYPFIGASPDGLIGEDTVVEVKCPYTSRNQEVNEQTVPYLERVDGSLTLKKTADYYYQCQGQLMVTGREACEFVIFTFKGFAIISIDRDNDFINEMCEKLVRFYEDYFQPALKNKYFYLRKVEE